MMRLFPCFFFVCLSIYTFPGIASGKPSQGGLELRLNILESTGGQWTQEAAFAFDFADQYEANAAFGKVCITYNTSKELCKASKVRPDASIKVYLAPMDLSQIGIADAKALVASITQARTQVSFRLGKTRMSVPSLWLEARSPMVHGLALHKASPTANKLFADTSIARLVYQQLTHMVRKRHEQVPVFRYIRPFTKRPALPLKKPATSSPTSQKAAIQAKYLPQKAAMASQKAAMAPQDALVPSKAYALWLYHLRSWAEFQPYHALMGVCSDRYTPEQAEKQYKALDQKQQGKMLQVSRMVLALSARSFRLLGDAKVSGLLQSVADGIRICQWGAFFVGAYLQYHATNAKRAFWKETLISKQGFTLGLMTAFCLRFAKNLLEDVANLLHLAQQAGHYGMVVAAWLLGKKYTGIKDLFCKWGHASKLCTAVNSVVRWGKGTYRVLRSGYEMGSKGVTLTVKYSKKAYRGMRMIYHSTLGLFLKSNPRSGKAYCTALSRARAFFRQEGVVLTAKEWTPKACAAP